MAVGLAGPGAAQTNGVGDALVPAAESYGLPGPMTAPSSPQGPPLFLTPSLGLQEDYTDNAELTGNSHQSDFITRAMAGLDADVNLGRLVGHMNGQYSYDWYSTSSALNGSSVYGNLAGTYVLWPDHFWIQAEGAITDGFTSTFGQSAVDRSGVDGRTQIGAYRIGPQFSTSPGGVIDVGLAANFMQVFYTDVAAIPNPLLPSNDNIYQLVARADTGERMGRLELLTTGQVEEDDHGFHNSNAVESLYYRISPAIRLIARAGYERLYQSGAADIDAPLVSAGLEWRPNAASIITLEGGQRYRRPAWAADATIKLGRALTFTGTYREAISPDQIYIVQSFSEFVSAASRLPTPIVPTTLTPQENLYNEASFNKTATARLEWQDPANRVTGSVGWSNREFLAIRSADRSVNGNVAYERKLRPDLMFTADASYSRTLASPIYGPNENYGGSATLHYLVNSTTDLRGTFAHQYGRQLTTGGASFAENVFLVAIQKRF